MALKVRQIAGEGDGVFLLSEGDRAMFNDDSMLESQCNAACIRLDTDHRNYTRVARLLEVAGGYRVPSRDGALYRFATCRERDNALNMVQCRFGWTVAIAFNRRLWMAN